MSAPVNVQLTFIGVSGSLCSLAITNSHEMKYTLGDSQVGLVLTPITGVESIAVEQLQVTNSNVRVTPAADGSNFRMNIGIQPINGQNTVDFSLNISGGAVEILTPAQRTTVQFSSDFSMRLQPTVALQPQILDIAPEEAS